MKFNYRDDIGDLDLTSLTKKAKLIAISLVSCIFLVVFLCFYALSEKFSTPSMTVHVNSEHYAYTPFDGDIPDIKLQAFYPSYDCDAYASALHANGVIEINPGTEVKLTRIKSNSITLTLLSDKSVGYLDGDFDSPELGRCFSAQIILDKDNPVFSMNMYGLTEFGKQVTDASDVYPPLVLDGKISLSDSTILSGEQYNLSPIEIRRGDYVVPESDANMKGFIRANYKTAGIQGIFTIEESNIYVQSYRTAPIQIKAGFVNRITNDFELAFSLTILILLIQLLGFVLNLSLRVKILKSQKELTNEVKKDNQAL